MTAADSLPRSGELMSPDETALLVVDVQERLVPAIADPQRIVWNVRRLLDGAQLLQVPVAVTEQYPKGLGPTVPELAQRLPAPHAKRDFSCAACADIFISWRSAGVAKILLAGMETHVCILQTALDLLADGFRVFLAADACGSRFEVDHQFGLRRLESSGVTLTTTEAVLMEWCRTSAAAEFRQISQLVRETAPDAS